MNDPNGYGGPQPHSIFYDDPASEPEAELRAAVCITVPDGWAPSRELIAAHIENGRYARIVHTGPYTELKTAYDWLYQTWLPNNRGAAGSALYRGVPKQPTAVASQ